MLPVVLLLRQIRIEIYLCEFSEMFGMHLVYRMIFFNLFIKIGLLH